MLTRRRLAVAAGAVALLVGGVYAAYFGAATAATADRLGVTNGSSVNSFSDLRVGEVFDLGAYVRNRSDTTVTLRPASLSTVPRHVRLLHELFIKGPYIGSRGWPPAQGKPGARGYSTARLDGYRLRPGEQGSIALGFVADHPGIYLVGPLVLHADVTGLFGLTFRASQPEGAYGLICAGVRKTRCDATFKSLSPKP